VKVALVYTSKKGMMKAFGQEINEEDDEPPPSDMFAECDSDDTIIAIQNVLSERWQVIPIESDENAFNTLRSKKPQLVFNIAECLFGPNRESYIPTICEILNIPYTGSDPLTLGICLDKSRAKEILSYYNIPTPEFHVVDSIEEIPDSINLPVIVKPLYEGSSKGIRNDSVVKNWVALKKLINNLLNIYKQPVIIERFITGREFTVGVLGNYPNLEILPIVEIDHSQLPADANPIYSYEAKWTWDRPENPLSIFKCPAAISSDLANRIKAIVSQTCKILRIRDWCRVDVRLDENGVPNILEINPLPGILPNPEDNSCLPKAARTAGYSYSALLHRVVDEALARNGLK